jgi:uncharacterized protein (DUF2336 family)
MTTATKNLAKRAESLRKRMDFVERRALAYDIGVVYNQSDLGETERAIAETIIQKLIEDEIVSVRAAIAQAVAGSPHLPGSIARKLALDIAEVAVPVLELSKKLEDQFLEEIIKRNLPEKIKAIAGREVVSPNLCRRIVATAHPQAVERLVRNPGAEITDYTMTTIVRIFGQDPKIEQAVLDRGELPETVLESLRLLTENHVATFIQRYFNLPERMIDIQRGKDLMERKTEERRNSNWWNPKAGVI